MPNWKRLATLVVWSAGAAALPAQDQANPQNSFSSDLQVQRRLEADSRSAITDQQDRFTNEEWLRRNPEQVKDPVVLPPMPMALAENVPDFPPPSYYPESFADCAGEIFFMPLGNLALRQLLKPALTQRVAAYQAARDELVAALQARLATALPLAPEARRQALADFATAQQAALQKLETEAEAIRLELTAVDTGAAVVKQRDSEETLKVTGWRNYLSSLLAAQFAHGLSLEQRQLLGEIALESVVRRPEDGQPAAFFLPSPARVRWPELPDTTAAEIEEFDRLRQALKARLVSVVVYDQETKLAPAKRLAKYAAFATEQAPQFEELQRLAEHIRVAVADLPNPYVPAASELPPELVSQVGRAVTFRNAFQATYSRRFKELSREFPPAGFKLSYESSGPVIQMFSMLENGAKAKAPSNELLLKLAACKARLERDYVAVTAEMEAARAAVQRFRETLTGDEVPEVNQLTAAFAQVYDRQQTWRRAADYYTAVLTPGLSPAQRRLLFGAALRDLEKYRLATTD